MDITIRNYRGVATADIAHEKITFIAGKNHNGKTSIAEAIAATLTGKLIPIADLLKRDIKKIVRDGAKDGSCKINDDGALALATWPDCKSVNDGKPIKNISLWDAGLESVLDLKPKDRGDALAKFIKADPTIEDLAKELRAVDLGPDVIDKLKKAVEVSGWQTMYLKAKERGAELKAQWAYITKERHGSQKAEGWAPAAYYPALGARTVEDLDDEIKAAKKDVEAGIAAAAVAGVEIDQLKAQAQDAPRYEDERKNAVKVYDELKAKIDTAQAEFNKLSDVPKEQGCPHCGGILTIVNGEIKAYEGMNDDEVNERTARLAQVTKDLAEYRDLLKETGEQKTIADQNLSRCRHAAAQLKDYEKNDEAGKWDKNLDECRARLEKAEIDRAALGAYEAATELNNGIKANKKIVDVLAPEGLRKTKLHEALSPFNKLLAELAEAAGWAQVRIDPDFNIFHNDRPILFCSASEKFKTRVIFQLAIGKLDNTRLVLIDGADIVVGTDRNGIFQAILAAGVPAIVFMSMGTAQAVPDLSGIGGRSYWIESGVLDEIKKQ